jgi:hypothetical protein
MKTDSTRAALVRILKRDGELTIAAVLREAEKPDSPLHARFQWDDRKAAFAFRIDQARHLIQHFQATIEVDGEERKFRGALRIHSLGPGVYKPLDEVLASPDLFSEALGSMKRELEGLAARNRFFLKAMNDYGKIDAKLGEAVALIDQTIEERAKPTKTSARRSTRQVAVSA